MVMAVASLILGLSAIGAEAPQKRVVDSPIIAEPYNMPSSLEGFLQRADAVVIARVVHARDVSRARRAKTEYDMQVTDTLKEHKDLGVAVTVCRAIGTVEYPDRIVRTYQPDLPGFEVGKDYLLFLAWDEMNRCFTPLFGPPSVAVLDNDGRVVPFVDHPALQKLKGLNRAEVAALVSAARSRR